MTEAFTEGRCRASKIKFDKSTWSGLCSGKFPIDCVLKNNDVVAVVWGDGETEDEEFAHLFASAPDLLQALEEVEPLLDLVNGSFGGGLTMTFTGSDAEDIETALSSVRKAISKARGKS